MEGVVGVEVDIYFISFVLMEHFKHTQWRHRTTTHRAGPASALPRTPTPDSFSSHSANTLVCIPK